MTKRFEDLLFLVDKSIERDPWVKEKGVKGLCEQVVEEAHEAIEALHDPAHLKDELGDVFSDLLQTCRLAECAGMFTLDDVLTAAIEKAKRRKPFLLEKEFKGISKEDARRIFLEAKKKEKPWKT